MASFLRKEYHAAQRSGQACPHCDEVLASQSAYETHISHYHPPKSAEIKGYGHGSGVDGDGRGYSSAPNTPVGHAAPATSQARLPANMYTPTAQASTTAQPQVPAPSTSFKVVFRDGTRVRGFLIPFDESYDAFLSRLGQVERTAMRYALVNHRGAEESTERLLSGGLVYQMMVSELVKRPEEWNHAVVWQVGR